jgi:hypothetical protein
MGMAGDPIPCDSEHEVTSQFRVVHRTGDVARKPIEIESDAEEELPTHMERGEMLKAQDGKGYHRCCLPIIEQLSGND